MGVSIPGRRVYPNTDGDVVLAEPGDYGRDSAGHWWVRPPRKGVSTGRLDLHKIIEHEDGTITVSPSILVNKGRINPTSGEWHGYLERGIWREI